MPAAPADVHGAYGALAHTLGNRIAELHVALAMPSEDPAFGFRLLVDVALRALSPSLNDPSTAIQAIDRLHELLSELRDRRIPSHLILPTDEGRQVLLPTPAWDDLVQLATSELGLACRALPQVRRHLMEMVSSLLREADPSRQPALRRARLELEQD